MTLEVRPARIEEALEISALIMHEFDRVIAPDYDEEGRRTFAGFVTPRGIIRRLDQDGIRLVATVDGRIVGFVQMRGDHIALLFVEEGHQRRGIGRRLVEEIGRTRPGRTITVNAAPFPVPAYERLGFSAAGEWQTKDGIRFLPMALKMPA